jgi:hypothetical protein
MRIPLELATSKDLVLVAWPSQCSQDIYVVDDLSPRLINQRRR